MSELAWWAKLANLCGDTAEGVEVAMSPLGKVEVVQRDLSDYGARYFVVNVWKPSGEKLQIIMVRRDGLYALVLLHRLVCSLEMIECAPWPVAVYRCVEPRICATWSYVCK
jgi:hypothetical protein